jgi:membrane-bound ClpP family serine protease
MALVTIVVGILCFLFICFLAVLGIRALKSKVVSGSESLIGEVGKVTKTLNPEGIVFVSREDYTARSKDETMIKAGAKVKVIAVDSAKLIVEKVK